MDPFETLDLEPPSNNNSLKMDDQAGTMDPVMLHHTEDEVFRSMKINDQSKTPYSDATQVRRSCNVMYFGTTFFLLLECK